MRDLPDRRLDAQPVYVPPHLVAHYDQTVARTERVAAQRQIARPPLVRDRVVDDAEDRDAALSELPRYGPHCRSEERHPVGQDRHVRALCCDPPSRSVPRQRVQRVQRARRSG